jgi:hypothetical protein
MWIDRDSKDMALFKVAKKRGKAKQFGTFLAPHIDTAQKPRERVPTPYVEFRGDICEWWNTK